MNGTLVFLGGGIGAFARYWLQGLIYRLFGTTFPYGTVSVNVIGCFLIGVLLFGLEDRFLLSPSLRLFLTIGVLGGFTTFSSFSFETIALARDGELLVAGLNIIANVALCLTATYVGIILEKSL